MPEAPVVDAPERAEPSEALGPLFQPHDLRSLRDRVYEDIREAILAGTLRPGDRIKERDIAAQMGVSTTPVKEALRRLEQAGLVISQPRRGAIVSTLTQTPRDELTEIEAAIEAIGARLAATRMTEAERVHMNRLVTDMFPLTESMADPDSLRALVIEFHEVIRAGSRNEFIPRLVEQIRPFERVNVVEYTIRDETRRITDEHAAIAAAIQDRDGAQAELLMRHHYLRAIEAPGRPVRGTSGRGAPGPATFRARRTRRTAAPAGAET